MIAALRRRHRLAAFAIVAAAPLLLAVALGARRPEARMEVLPAALRATTPGPDAVLLDEIPDLWADLDVQTRRFADGPTTWVELAPRAPLRHPDLLVYWLPSEAAVETFPERATLLGPLRGREPQFFALPAPGGALLLYSVAHDTTVARAGLRPPAEPR